MLQQLLFSIYITFLILSILFLSINYYRIQDKQKTNPQIIVFMIPFILNFLIAKFVFYQINPFFTTLLPCLFIFFVGRKLKNIRIIGLTGGIATGKSTLVKQIKNNIHKLKIIDCDQIAKQLRLPKHKGYNLIVKLLGQKAQQFLQINKQLKKQKLSNYVFQNTQFRKQLTSKMGKLIMWQIFKELMSSIYSGQNLIMIDAPILFQSKILQYFCYPIIVVGCSQELQITRLKQRNQFTQEQAINRIKSQMPLAIKKKKSDIYIKNQSTQDQLLKQTLTYLTEFLQKKQK